MNVTIVGFKNYNEVDKKMQEMIEKSQVFLFNVLATSSDSIGYKWAKNNGAPIILLQSPTLEEIIAQTDYLLINYDGSTNLHQLIFKYMQTGKHGSVIEEVKYR